MSRRKSRRMMNQINVVPYIDVMLVLLVIFMVTAPMTNPGVVELPSVGQALKQPVSPPLVLSVKADKRIELDGKLMQRDELLFAVRTQLEKDPQRSVVIAADKSVNYGEVIAIMDLMKQGQVEKVGLLLSPIPN
ncbi:MAG: hypothetical protein RL194_1072 [Pseudomonadota bacterium]|jgi:biopolymer transport protein TolR